MAQKASNMGGGVVRASTAPCSASAIVSTRCRAADSAGGFATASFTVSMARSKAAFAPRAATLQPSSGSRFAVPFSDSAITTSIAVATMNTVEIVFSIGFRPTFAMPNTLIGNVSDLGPRVK